MRTTFVTKEQARAWFAAREKQIVGKTRSAASCPLAQCVSNLVGLPAEVGGQINVGRMYQSEPWIVEFVHAVDGLGDAGTQVAGVTAASLLS